MNVHLTARSRNKKTGPIPVSTTTADTCNPACPHIDKTCYAAAGPLSLHWDKVTAGKRGVAWHAFCQAIARLPVGQLWRHNQAGDLPGIGPVVDPVKLRELVQANRGRRGFTFTHKAMTAPNRQAIRLANRHGFTVNLSADSPRRADELLALGIGPVVTVLPWNLWRRKSYHTPAGARIVICPAQTRENINCATCGLCARPERATVVGFLGHGTRKRAINPDMR